MTSTVRDLGLLLFRLGISWLMIAYHGWQKLEHLFEGGEIKFADPIGIGVTLSFVLALVAEFLCSLFVALGLFTRYAAIPLLMTMFVAVFFYHAADPFIEKQLPTLFMFGYILLLLAGPGKYSLDKIIRNKA